MNIPNLQNAFPDTAILIFSHDAETEALNKRFLEGGSKQTNVRISRTLIRQTLKTAKATGLDFILHSSAQQKGEGFGERLHHAMESVFQAGYHNVITIGNDCPTLRPEDLLHAAGLLQAKGSVTGAESDGGAYLIGLSRETFDSLDLPSLPWCTAALFDALVESLNNFSSPALLRTRMDVDSAGDLQKILHSPGLKVNLRSKLLSLLQGAKAVARPPLPLNIPGFSGDLSALRAPPARV